MVGTSNGRFGDRENHEQKQVLKCRTTNMAEIIFFIWKKYGRFIDNLDSTQKLTLCLRTQQIFRILIVLVFSVAMTKKRKFLPKHSLGEERDYMAYASRSQSINEGSQYRHPNQNMTQKL